MALVKHSYIWNRYAAKTFFTSLTKIERQEIILPIEYSYYIYYSFRWEATKSRIMRA